MTSISATSSTYTSPLQKLQDQLQAEVNSGAVSSSDQSALSAALTACPFLALAALAQVGASVLEVVAADDMDEGLAGRQRLAVAPSRKHLCGAAGSSSGYRHVRPSETAAPSDRPPGRNRRRRSADSPPANGGRAFRGPCRPSRAGTPTVGAAGRKHPRPSFRLPRRCARS